MCQQQHHQPLAPLTCLALTLLPTPLTRVVIYQSSFINNSVSTGCTANCVGGAISLTVISNSVNITNSTFVNNSASSGGAIYATDVSNMLVCNVRCWGAT